MGQSSKRRSRQRRSFCLPPPPPCFPLLSLVSVSGPFRLSSRDARTRLGVSATTHHPPLITGQADGSTTQTSPDGTIIHTSSDGTTDVGSPDGTRVVRFPGGREIHYFADGSRVEKRPSSTSHSTPAQSPPPGTSFLCGLLLVPPTLSSARATHSSSYIPQAWRRARE